MKKQLGALALLVATATLPACGDDFLTEVPSDFVSPENFYRNEGDAVAAQALIAVVEPAEHAAPAENT